MKMQPATFLPLWHSHCAIVTGFQYASVEIVKTPRRLFNLDDVVTRKVSVRKPRRSISELLDQEP